MAPLMDKFLIRTPRSPQTVLREQKEEPRKVQSSLFSLKGVVVVEDLVKAKNLLRDEDVDPERKVKVLRQLGEKQPSTELLETTGIGRTDSGGRDLGISCHVFIWDTPSVNLGHFLTCLSLTLCDIL